MKKILSILLSAVMVLTGCSTQNTSSSPVVSTTIEQITVITTESDTNTVETTTIPSNETVTFPEQDIQQLNFSTLSDPALARYVEDTVYADLVSRLNSDDCFVENVSTQYISKEYIEELEYNSQENIYFGYTLSDLNKQFEGKKYVFTLGDDGNTTVKEFEEFSYGFDLNKVIKNVAIGSGVILICVTVSIATAGAAPAVSAIFAASAETATAFALSGTVISSASSAIVTGAKTGDINAAMLSAISSGSEGFKWGAISGAIVGGTSETLAMYKGSKTIPTPRESEIRALKKYGGDEQIAFLNGEEVAYNFENATRPDLVIRNSKNGALEAIEVKNYDLEGNFNNLCRELKRQVESRNIHLPDGSTQRIVLDVKGRGYSNTFIKQRIMEIQNYLSESYLNIPIDVLR